jgi:hypothetical protein
MAYDLSLFEQQRRNLQQSYAQNAALNAYRKYLAETAGQRPITTLEEAAFKFGVGQGYLGEVPKITSSYAQRGLQGQGVKSGIYNRALSQYASDRARNLGYARADLANQMRGYDLAGSQALAGYQQGLADIESDKARQIAADAQALLNLR